MPPEGKACLISGPSKHSNRHGKHAFAITTHHKTSSDMVGRHELHLSPFCYTHAKARVWGQIDQRVDVMESICGNELLPWGWTHTHTQTHTHTAYDRIFGDPPAKNTVYTPHIGIWFWPALFSCPLFLPPFSLKWPIPCCFPPLFLVCAAQSLLFLLDL